MSRYTTTFIIFTAVTALVIISQSFIISRCEKWLELTKEAEYFIKNSQFDNAAGAVKEIAEDIDKSKRKLMMLIEHEEYEELSAKVNRTLTFLLVNEKSLASAELTETRGMLKDLKASQRLLAENIV